MKNLPKIELHCHLDGSLRPKTVLELAKGANVALPSEDVEVLKSNLQAPEDCPSLSEYLKRFDLPVAVMQTEENLKRVAFELMEDCAKENVKYIEIRFAPLFHQQQGLTIEQIIESVLAGMNKAASLYDIKGNLILSFLKFMPTETIIPVLEVAKKYLKQGVVAVDLAGNEDEGFAHKFIEPMAHAKELGFHITVHAGETGFGQNVLDSIELLGAERIGHGVNIRDHKGAYDKVKQLKIPLEMCPTSNVQTKAVQGIKDHPVATFADDNVVVTISTDNRTVSNTTMTKEIEICQRSLSINESLYKDIFNNSVEATFASSETKKWLQSFSK